MPRITDVVARMALYSDQRHLGLAPPTTFLHGAEPDMFNDRHKSKVTSSGRLRNFVLVAERNKTKEPMPLSASPSTDQSFDLNKTAKRWSQMISLHCNREHHQFLPTSPCISRLSSASLVPSTLASAFFVSFRPSSYGANRKEHGHA